MFEDELGMEIKLARMRLNVTQTQLGQKLNMGRDTLSIIERERERAKNIKLRDFIKLCVVLDDKFYKTVFEELLCRINLERSFSNIY